MMKFFCDEMLRGLGRWLRAAGYDTKIAQKQMDDLQILEIAIHERRLLLTRDQTLAKVKKAENHLLLLKANNLPDIVRELNGQLELNWLHNPFSRCLLCNTALEATEQGLWYCSHCKKVYWQASHTTRMHQKLTIFQGLR